MKPNSFALVVFGTFASLTCGIRTALPAALPFPTNGLQVLANYVPANSDVYHNFATSWTNTPVFANYERAFTGSFSTPQPLLFEVIQGVTNLLGLLQSSATLTSTPPGVNGNTLRQRLTDEVRSVLTQLRFQARAQQPDEPWADFLQRTLVSNPFVAEPYVVGDLTSQTRYFAGRPTELVLSMSIKSGEFDDVTTVYFATEEQAVEFRSVTQLISKHFAAGVVPALNQWAAKLRINDEAWDNYLGKGFSQYPWESYLNSFVTPKLFGKSGQVYWDRPPVHQLIAFHPEPGLVLDVRTASRAQVQPALLVEGFGYVRYFGERRSWFLGVSAAGSISDSDFGLGFGPMIHFGGARFAGRIPHISVGALWHDYDDKGQWFSQAPAIGISVDLWRLFSKGSSRDVIQSLLQP